MKRIQPVFRIVRWALDLQVCREPRPFRLAPAGRGLFTARSSADRCTRTCGTSRRTASPAGREAQSRRSVLAAPVYAGRHFEGWFGLLLAAWMIIVAPLAIRAAEAPRITAIEFDAAELVVTAEVPAGVACLVLEGCQRGDLRGWVPRAVRRVSGAGTVTFRLPGALAASMEMFRVRADDSEPLPASFYRGPTVFRGSRTIHPGLLPDTGKLSVVDPAFVGVGAPLSSVPGTELSLRASDVGVAAPSPRNVAESDIWRLRGDKLYFFNHLRGLQVIDVSHPDAPRLLATLPLPAVGEQMYLLDESHVVLLARARPCDSGSGAFQESAAIVVDVTGDQPREIARLPISGRLVESRLVGSALYVATESWKPKAETPADSVAWVNGTFVTGIDLSSPDQPVAQPALWLPGAGNVVTATAQFLFVGATEDGRQAYWDSDLHIIDITNPAGVLREFTKIPLRGRAQDKFKIHLNGDVLSVITAGPQRPDGGGRWRTALTTYRLASPAQATIQLASPAGAPAPWTRLGSVEVGHGENLFASRFDGERAYIVTFRQIDPLWIVDLSRPEAPRVLGELEIPGWSTYIHPLGDRLLTVGIDNTGGQRAAVQLFDVADPAKPRLLAKVPLGQGWSSSEANEDEKALAVFPEAGLVLLPFVSYGSSETEQGIQLIDFGQESLKARGVVRSSTVVPRRSTLLGDRVLAVSSREVVNVDVTDRDRPVVKGALELAWPVDRVLPVDGWLMEFSGTTLRVRQPGAAESSAHTVELGSLPVRGAAVNGDAVYVLQGQPPTRDWQGTNWVITRPGTLKLSVFAVPALPALVPLNTLTESVNDIAEADYEALWPRPGLLVWDASQDTFQPMPMEWGGGIIVFDNVAVRSDITFSIGQSGVLTMEPAAPSVTLRLWEPGADGSISWGRPGGINGGIRFEPGWNGGVADLWFPPRWPLQSLASFLVFDVSDPATPRYANKVASPEGAIARSSGSVSAGLLYFSHDVEHNEITGTNSYTYVNYEPVEETREVIVTNRVPVPIEILVTNVAISRVGLSGWSQPLPDATAVTAGRRHALAIDAAGSVVAWGDNRSGQLGSDGITSRDVAEVVGLSGPATSVAAAGWFSLALLSRGEVWTWGSADGPPPPPVPGEPPVPFSGHVPRQVSGLPAETIGLAAGYSHALAWASDGTLFAWGANGRGQLGVGDLSDRTAPVVVTSGVIGAAGGAFHSLALTAERRALQWGDNSHGQLGTPGVDSDPQPREVPGLSNLRALSAGAFHSLALDADGAVWAWGSNTEGQTGAEGPTPAEPAPVDGLPHVRAVAAGIQHSLALDDAGTVWSWGGPTREPHRIEGLGPVRAIAAAGDYGVALMADGTCHTWGYGTDSAPRGAVPHGLTLTRVLGTNLVTQTIYRYETNITTKRITETHWREVIVTNFQPVYRYWRTHHLNVVDFNVNPDNPVTRAPVSLPGVLQGISHEGALLYTLASRTDEAQESVSRAWLEAGAYDGVAVHLVTSLPVADETRGESALVAVEPDGLVWLARQRGNDTNTLALLALNTDGRFDEFTSRPLEKAPRELKLLGDVLAASTGETVSLFESPDGRTIAPLGPPFEFGCLVARLNRLAGDRTAGVWAPLGEFGSAPLWEPSVPLAAR